MVVDQRRSEKGEIEKYAPSISLTKEWKQAVENRITPQQLSWASGVM